MELKIGSTAQVEGLTLVEVIFLGRCALGDRTAFAEVRGRLEDLLRSQDPDAVLMNLMSAEEISADDLRELAHIAIAPDRPDRPRLCALAVRKSWTLVSFEGRPVHSFYVPRLLTCVPDRNTALWTLERHLADLAVEPKGQWPVYFPARSLHAMPMLHWSLARCFSKILWRMQEPSLSDLSRSLDYHGYRFLWLRTFHEPVSVRLEIRPDATGVLFSKKTSGKGGDFPGRLVVDQSRTLPGKVVSVFLRHLKKATIWVTELGPDEVLGEASDWVLEGAKGGSYRDVFKGCPEEGAFLNAAIFLLEHSGIDLEPID